MRLVVNAPYKSIPRGVTFDLPKFCVLTGKNGSGKSHLLEAIANKGVVQVFDDCNAIVQRIHHIGYNGLNPQVDEQCDSNQLSANIKNWWNQIYGSVSLCQHEMRNGAVFTDVFTQLLPRTGLSPTIYPTIKHLLAASGKEFHELSEDDAYKYINFVYMAGGENTLFFSQSAMIFKAYQTRKFKNDVAQFMAAKKNDGSVKFLSDEEFLFKYGPPPWELINEILNRASLPYIVVSPDNTDPEISYRLRLQDVSSGLEISVNDLSSGEKVLMSLALAIYNAQEGGTKPELLLLDEPDAPLHPEFSKLLIETLHEVIVKTAGVSVVMTTHSPSTVAMAPDNCVYEMDKFHRIPHLVSNSRALEILTEGIHYLKVSYERRRQVFVESKYDVQYFQRLFNLLNRKYSYKYQAVFLEPHNGSSNCTDVITIVEKLKSTGNDLVWGIIDYDNSNESKDTIVVLGGGTRYAIENFILDPLYVALSLIRFGKKTFLDFGVLNKNSYVDALLLSQADCQNIIETTMKVLGLQCDNWIESKLENGFLVSYPKSFLFLNGHVYEELLKERFSELGAITRGSGDSALKLGVIQVIEELPQFLSSDINITLEKIGRS